MTETPNLSLNGPIPEANLERSARRRHANCGAYIRQEVSLIVGRSFFWDVHRAVLCWCIVFPVCSVKTQQEEQGVLITSMASYLHHSDALDQ